MPPRSPADADAGAVIETRTARASRAASKARAALSRASRRAVMAAAVALGATLLMNAPVEAAVTVGQRAPDFVATDVTGKQHRLSDFAGKYVVLEWTNPGCPFVRKHYGGNMQSTQKAAADKGVVWLAINSTERAASDYLPPPQLAAWMKEKSAAASHVLMDEEGTIGRAYGARTTPHLYIVDPKGVLVYAGGIDSVASARESDIKSATNYVNQALGEAFGGKAISAAATRAYGCSIKYKT